MNEGFVTMNETTSLEFGPDSYRDWSFGKVLSEQALFPDTKRMVILKRPFTLIFYILNFTFYIFYSFFHSSIKPE